MLPKGHSRPQIEPVVENISSGSREKRAEWQSYQSGETPKETHGLAKEIEWATPWKWEHIRRYWEKNNWVD